MSACYLWEVTVNADITLTFQYQHGKRSVEKVMQIQTCIKEINVSPQQLPVNSKA